MPCVCEKLDELSVGGGLTGAVPSVGLLDAGHLQRGNETRVKSVQRQASGRLRDRRKTRTIAKKASPIMSLPSCSSAIRSRTLANSPASAATASMLRNTARVSPKESDPAPCDVDVGEEERVVEESVESRCWEKYDEVPPLELVPA